MVRSCSARDGVGAHRGDRKVLAELKRPHENLAAFDELGAKGRSKVSANRKTRLERLESHANAVRHRVRSRMGHLKRLPPGYKGERHIVIAKQLPNISGQEWVEYEERPGPEPPPNRNAPPECGGMLEIMFVAPYPRVEGEHVEIATDILT